MNSDLNELNLSQIGYQEVDFGGQIIVEDGSAFTHKDNFENLNGTVNFDNKGFNPLINLSAYTMIDNERIELRMVGGIDEPEIIPVQRTRANFRGIQGQSARLPEFYGSRFRGRLNQNCPRLCA